MDSKLTLDATPLSTRQYRILDEIALTGSLCSCDWRNGCDSFERGSDSARWWIDSGLSSAYEESDFFAELPVLIDQGWIATRPSRRNGSTWLSLSPEGLAALQAQIDQE